MQHDFLRGTVAAARPAANDSTPSSGGTYAAAVTDAEGNAVMVGDSAPMRRVFELIRRFGPVDQPVMIMGETGTGKELTARALHARSRCAAGPFMAINCAALPANLIGAELFGHEKGAFTDAGCRRQGMLELADGGSLLLDEIGDLPLDLQGHLLRFLQEGQIFRLGGRQPIPVHTRVLAATHVDLPAAIKAGRFREDLFYRLNVLRIVMPPLRDRPGDIELIARSILRNLDRAAAQPPFVLTDLAMTALLRHHWPGNIRELASCLRRAAILTDGPVIDVDELGLPPPVVARTRAAHDRRPVIDRETALAAIKRADDNRTQAARDLGISRVTLYRALRRQSSSLPPSG